MSKRLQNKVAGSRFALPVTTIYAMLMWVAMDIKTQEWHWLPLACYVVAVYLMVELNNTNALIRIFSRMVSCSMLMLTVCTLFLFVDQPVGLTAVCIMVSLTTLFHTYQDPKAAGWSFYSFLGLGLATMVSPQMLWMAVAYWLVMAACLRSWSIRTFLASLMGLTMPYWFALPVLIATGDVHHTWQQLYTVVDFTHVADIEDIDIRRWTALAATVTLGIIGSIHFVRSSVNDKIKTRMLFYSFITMWIAAMVVMVIHTIAFDHILIFMIICISPLMGHFIALTNTKITNMAFIMITVALIVLAQINLWLL